MRRRLRSRPPTAIAVIAMITALGVRVSLTTRLSLTNRRARLAIVGGGWTILERHVVAFEEVELPVMAGTFDVGALVEVVVVAQDLTEVLAVEGVGEVVEKSR